jgi:hypothetical protein
LLPEFILFWYYVLRFYPLNQTILFSMRPHATGSLGIPFPFKSLIVLCALSVACVQIFAQEQVVADPLYLESSPILQEVPSAAQRKNGPIFLQGDHISGRPDLEAVVEGNAELRKSDFSIHADRLEYYQPSDQARATGNVKITIGTTTRTYAFESPADGPLKLQPQ